MSKTKIPKRDLYLLLIGILLAFLIQVVYEELSELMTNQINGNWMIAQAVIATIIGIVLIAIILSKLQEEKN
jgi:uncharacterized membrane protein